MSEPSSSRLCEKGVVPDVVEKSCIRNECGFLPRFLRDSTALPETPERCHCQVIDPDRVVESGVCRTGIDQVRESELFDIPLPLERCGVDDTNRRGVEPNRVPEGVADDPLFTVGRHVRRLAGPDWLGQWLFARHALYLPNDLPNEKRKSNLDEFTPLPRRIFKHPCPPPPSANMCGPTPKTARASIRCWAPMETLCM